MRGINHFVLWLLVVFTGLPAATIGFICEWVNDKSEAYCNYLCDKLDHYDPWD